MFVPDRRPAAHQVAASQDKYFKGCHVYVESGCDCRFWKTFFNLNNVKLRACNGWPNVVDSVIKGNNESIVCIGIVDRDFRDYVANYGELPQNVFVSDEHDVEMTIIKAEGIERVINNFDPSDHIQRYEVKEGAKVLDIVLGISNRIGVLKLLDRRENLNFKLRKVGKGDEFDLPSYEKILDKEGHFISNQKMVEYLIGWSTSNKSQPSKSLNEILTLYEAEDIANYDSYKLSSGHDVTYLIAYLIWKHISGEKTDKEELERILRATYSTESFKKTAIRSTLLQWGENSGIPILREG